MSQRDEGTQQRILDAAGTIFARNGFEKSTIREICARAEANVAAVNYHFGDKEKLYKATILHAHQFVAAQVPMPQWAPDTPPEKKLRDFIHTMMQRMLGIRELPWQSQLMLREFMEPTGACRDLVDDYIRPHFDILLGILEELLPADVSAHRRLQIGFSIVAQAAFYKMHAPVIRLLVSEEDLQKDFTPELLTDHITNFTLAALGWQPFLTGTSSGLNMVSVDSDKNTST